MKYLMMLILLTSPIFAFAAEPIQTQTLAEGVYVLTGNGGNILAVTGGDGVVIVDDKFAEDSEEIKNAISGLGGGPVKFVLNTHWHQDHTGGNVNFADTAVIISHANVRKRLESDQFIEFFNKTVKASPKQALPVVVFDESIGLRFNDHEINVSHLPAGHTDGDSYVYISDLNILHTGDQFFNGFYPFIDTDHGGSIAGYIRNVQHLIEISDKDTVIVPGHGPVGDRRQLQQFYVMLNETSKIVADEMRKGMSVEAIQKKGLGDRWLDWGNGFLSEKKWIGILFKGLS